MRDRRCVVAVSAALLGVVLMAAPASAQAPGCCGSGPVVVYGAAPVPPIVPPTGYVLDPSDARPPLYVVNQGPTYRGPGIYAVPTYSEGGYAVRGAYPYVTGSVGWWAPYPYAPRYLRPRVRVYGDAIAPDARPAGVPPYGAYAVRAAPDAKVIRISQHDGEPADQARPPRPVAPQTVPAPERAPATPPLPRPAPGPSEDWTRR